ncbi:YicC/YloC family endoribonuclease [Methylobrevis albus]|uniref:YicC family protein n=1 Tax=Methylobrevis albus TaxID=2793297 RepID=A0A931I6H3_9HYPH|nr:YicC/YloC family endoribonuclease [Methylobrevis albus]MBH0239706.1 YicC family protein [Methylobrevis albus]
MPIVSMTGFARHDGHVGPWRFAWELRSVNGRGLDLRLRLPPGAEAIEAQARAKLQGGLARGSVNCTLTLERDGAASGYAINQTLLDLLVETAKRYEGEKHLRRASIDGLLAVRGVVEPVAVAADEAATAARDAALVAAFDTALTAFKASRAEEGAALARILSGQIDTIESLAAAAEACPARQPEAIRARLADQLSALFGRAELDPQRLNQEAMLIAAKADVREELDRLGAHVAQARGLLAADGAVGRRLDFLAQEFNRETNTLCSKSNDTRLTEIGLALKAVVDQFKEQVQNVE